MRSTAKIVGIAGGACGLLAGLAVAVVAAVLSAMDDGGRDAGLLLWFGLGALVMGGIGLTGGLMADRHRALSVVLLLVPGLAGFLSIGPFWVPAGILLIAGAFIELVYGRKRETGTPDLTG